MTSATRIYGIKLLEDILVVEASIQCAHVLPARKQHQLIVEADDTVGIPVL